MSLLKIQVVEIKGKCPVYRIGDKIQIKDAEIDMKNTDALCIHALPSLLHYTVSLREGISPVKLGLSKEESCAYLRCPDPGEPYTPGGTVVFEIIREK